jgi:hypothetical protein
MHSRILATVGLAGLIIVAFAASVPIRDGQLRNSGLAADANEPAVGQYVRETYTFSDLGQMVAASDVVVVGTVEKSSRGRSIGVASETGGLTFTDVEVRIENVHFGQLGTETVALEIDETVFPETYDPKVERKRWDVPGTRVLLFLHEKTDRAGVYRPTNTQGVFFVDGEVVTAAVVRDQFTTAEASVGRSQLFSRIAAAASAVGRGDIKPPAPAR